MSERSIVDLVEAINSTTTAAEPRPRIHQPIAEQIAIIEAAPHAAHLVAAGAGSGKTETMSLRAMWLIANGYARPAEVLGLTFTRKAAGELAQRMRDRIRQLRRAGLIPRAAESDELLDSPRVATYNSFATQLYRDRAPLVGRDPDAAVLSEAGAWLLARDVVRRSALGLDSLERTVSSITTDTVQLARLLGENVVDPARVHSWAAELVTHLTALPDDGTKKFDDPVVELAANVAALPVLVDLAAEFQAEKRRRGLIEFSDQVTIALELARAFPEIGAEQREQSRAVILDEYQDTSFVQTELLAALFAGHPVMAVGDPHQSIYGWRGASAANLAHFGTRFSSSGDPLSLTTSWRNDRAILAAANVILQPLIADSPISVRALTERPGASDGEVDACYAETIVDEAEYTARWFAERLDPAASRGGSAPPTAALLLRSWKSLSVFRRALHDANVPVQVLGGGGLLAEPAVADLVAALAVVNDPGAGSELVRLLAGSRWRVGAADLAALRALAQWQADRDLSHRLVPADVRQRLRDSVAADDGASLVDALDLITGLPDDHGALGLAGFSAEGLLRLREAGALFARLRRRPHFGIADLATATIHELRLDIEVVANEARPGGMRVFESFFDAVAGFEQLELSTGLGSFLAWLREAASRDRLSSPVDAEPRAGCVQLLTIHAAKGLEWDYVAVPRLVEGELPARPQDKETWLQFGKLPYEFRGDRAQLPDFDWRSARDRRILAGNREEYNAAERDRQIAEARRLSYVAVTRARSGLLLTGSWWSTQQGSRPPSIFLRELAAAGVIGGLPDEPQSTAKAEVAPEESPWPRDPLGARRARVEGAAELVRAARAAQPEPAPLGTPDDRHGPYAADVALLLAERAEREAGAATPSAPLRIPASRFHRIVHDPAAELAEVHRPMPQRPFTATRRGTEFHSWAERLFTSGGDLNGLDFADDLDADPGDDQWFAARDPDDLAAVRERFLESSWAQRKPLEVECEIHLPFDGRVVICRIDAVFPGRDDPSRVEIVDWKTGRIPAPDELASKQLQLALYRVAYAAARGIPLDRIDASFVYVESGTEVRADDLPDQQELIRRWRDAIVE